MQTNPVNFRKYRDFGDLLGDTFAFLKQEFRFLMKVLLTYAGPFILVTAIASAWFQSSMLSVMGMMMRTNPSEILAEFGLKILLYMVAALVSNTVLICVIYSYIEVYIERGKDGFSQEAVWFRVGKKFFHVLGAVILMGLIIGVGLIFCFIPGIYFSISLCLVFATLFFENQSVGSALGRSMSLVKSDFWFALGIGFVIYLIVGVASYIFVIPSAIFSMFVSFNTLSGNDSETMKIIYMVLVAIGTFGATLLGAVPHITFSLFYHGQIEKKESPGLLSKIEQINNPESENNNSVRF